MGVVRYSNTHDEVERINALDGESRSQALGAFVMERRTMFERYASKEAENRRLPRDVVEDLVQEMSILAVRMVDDDRSQPGIYSATGHQWEAIFTQKARNVLRSYLDGAGGSAMSGANGAARRMRYLSQRRSEMEAELGREPTKKELIAYANAHAQERRANAVRQGLVFSEKDLTPTSAMLELSDAILQTIPGDDVTESASQAKEYARRLTAAAAASSPLLGELAHVWLLDVLSGESFEPDDWQAVCAEFGLSRSQCGEAQGAITKIALEVRS